MGDTLLSLTNILKSFGGVPVLRNIDLTLYKGEFFTLLGPSGCGKTTTLRIIAGLESPDEGQVFLNNREITYLEPNKRNVNTVFQKYALFPYYTVFQNVAYGLKIRKIPGGEIKSRVEEALCMVQMREYAERMPNALSGGQQQRVAVARAIVNRPEVLLLDEPLGALDLKLRKQMQLELKRLQKSLGITFVYVTHDQDEALTMSDRIGVMREGQFEQIGTPPDIYNNPVSEFVADFVGETNLLKARVLYQTGHDLYRLELPFGNVDAKITGAVEIGGDIQLSIRPEHIHYSPRHDSGPFVLRAVIRARYFHGATVQTVLRFSNGAQLIANEMAGQSGSNGLNPSPAVGDEVCLFWLPEHSVVVGRYEDDKTSVAVSA
jgi:spermidine/putrescine transport system ATP-binding protein